MTLGGRRRSGTTVGFGDIAADTTLDRVYITALMVAIPLAPLPAGTDAQYGRAHESAEGCPFPPVIRIRPASCPSVHPDVRPFASTSFLHRSRATAECGRLQMIATCLFSRMVGDMHDLLQFASKEETALAERMEVRPRARSWRRVGTFESG